MRSVLVMLLFSTTAVGATPLAAIDRDSIPPKCLDLAARADSPEPALAQTSRLPLAICIATERARPIALCDCKQSIDELDVAIAPAIQMLDELAKVGEPAYRILALEAQADQYQVLANKILATLPPPRSDASGEQRELYEIRQNALRPLLEPWRAHARDAYVEIDRLATLHPELANNREVQAAVRDSRQRLAPAVAQP